MGMVPSQVLNLGKLYSFALFVGAKHIALGSFKQDSISSNRLIGKPARQKNLKRKIVETFSDVSQATFSSHFFEQETKQRSFFPKQILK